ncbi:MAG: GNAT family N-acetyltransferase, partial [Pseudomonadota bacterium]
MTAEIVARDLVDAPGLTLLVADSGGVAVGYALLTASYETCYAVRGVYLIDLAVAETAQRQGIGRALMRAAAREAVAAVRVDWEVLPHVLDVEEAIAPGAPSVNETYPNNTFDYHERYDHQKLRFGDVEAGFAAADHIVEAEYQMSPIEQAPMETCGAIAAPET